VSRHVAPPDVVKSRKENLQDSPEAHEAIISANDSTVRKVAQPFAINSGNTSGAKRQRIITPASFMAIDEEDEPKSSPTLRLSSRGNIVDGDVERRVLSGIENLV
jgi:hypothetical protein